ncbi:MAG: Dabb family protein [Sulfitobacter sp.]
MIKHIVLFRFREDAPDDKIAALMAEYETFSDKYPVMQTFDIGWNQSERDDRFDAGFVIEFRSQDEMKSYLDSDSHKAHVVERFRPIIKERAIVSFSYEPRAGRVNGARRVAR